MDFHIPGISKVGGFSMCSSPQTLAESGTLDLAVKDSTWPPTNWLHRKAKLGDRVNLVVGGYPSDINRVKKCYTRLVN